MYLRWKNNKSCYLNKEILDMTYGFTSFRWSAAQKLLKKYADTDEMKYKLLRDAL